MSVLPEHVAVKMRQDLGSALDSQFKKIYMSRHENVRYVQIYMFVYFSSKYVHQVHRIPSEPTQTIKKTNWIEFHISVFFTRTL